MDNPRMLWDIFCKVIDNFGDIGVCWRLSADLSNRGHQVRLWVDDASALDWMAPGALQGKFPGVEVYPWAMSSDPKTLKTLPIADVWIESFGCEIAPEFIAACAYLAGPDDKNKAKFPVWINLEYLSAEAYVEKAHGLPSPVMHGPGKGLAKYFFYPGFNANTGGLLREPHAIERQRAWDQQTRSTWLGGLGVAWQGELLVSLFCYEPQALPALLEQLAHGHEATMLLVTAGRSQAAVGKAWHSLQWESSEHCGTSVQKHGNLTVNELPALSQSDYDHLLWTCDLNFVRGEDSLVRALWAGKPFVWQIYPQDDGAHLEKLDAFLATVAAPPYLQRLHRYWNTTNPSFEPNAQRVLPLLGDMTSWDAAVKSTRARLWAQVDLSTQLIQFVQKKR